MSLFITVFFIILVYKFAYKPASDLLMGLLKGFIRGLGELSNEWKATFKKK